MLAALLQPKKRFLSTPPMVHTPLFPPTPYSADLGKTIGLPKFGYSNDGTMPIRTLTSRFIDSGQHLMNLRVSTADDPPGMRPISVVMIGKDRRDTIQAVKQERQTEEYKLVSAVQCTAFYEFVAISHHVKPPDI
jgi:hypothetical protein